MGQPRVIHGPKKVSIQYSNKHQVSIAHFVDLDETNKKGYEGRSILWSTERTQGHDVLKLPFETQEEPVIFRPRGLRIRC